MATALTDPLLDVEGAELLDALLTGVFVLDADLTVIYLNAAAQTLIGISRDQARGRRIVDLARGAETLLPLFARAREDGEPVVQRELSWPVPGGADRILDCAVTQVWIGGGAEARGGAPRLLLEIEDIAAPAADARECADRAARRQPADGSPARPRDQESARWLARGGAAARARAARSGLARLHAHHHQRGRPADAAPELDARARQSAREGARQCP